MHAWKVIKTMMIRVFVLQLFICLLTPSGGTNVIPLKITIDEGAGTGHVIADSFHIFGVPRTEQDGKYFEIVSDQQIKLSHKTEKLKKNVIKVSRDTGIVTLNDTIDRYSLCGQSIKCVLLARIAMLPSDTFRLLELNVHINDINDNAPTFPADHIFVNISERLKAGDVINLNQYQAQDKDIGNNSLISYTMTPNSFFNMEAYSDEAERHNLQLRVIKEVDFESQTTHNYQITATDHGIPPRSNHSTLSINIIDSNDNSPVFERQNYVVFVSENFSPGTKIAQVKAKDLDSGRNGQVMYKLLKSSSSPNNRLGLLSVDPESGDVVLLQELDRSTDDGAKFEIEAYDLGNPSLSRRVWLTLEVEDVNDHGPKIKMTPIMTMIDGKGYLSESAREGAYIAYVSASDDDQGENGEVELKVRTFAGSRNGGNEVNNQFIIAEDGLLLAAKSFNREVINQYYVTINACDKGKPQRCSTFNFSIEILDENDNRPKFSQDVYEVTLSEADEVGSDVISVIAQDDDSLNGPSKMMNQEHTIVPSTNGDIMYTIAKAENTFSIDRKSGKVVLTRPLDREGRSSWEITIKATDQGRPSNEATCLLIINVIDVNDNPPVFISPPDDDVTVYASIKLEQPIIKIEVVDYDSDEYSDVIIRIAEIDGTVYRQGNDEGLNLFKLFLLDELSGELYINKSARNLQDLLGRHYVTIEATDNGNPSLSNKVAFYIDVSDLLVLPTPPPPGSTDLSSGSPLSFSILLTIIISSLAFFFLFILTAAIGIVKCRKRHEMKRSSYNCQNAEDKLGCGKKSFPAQSSKENHIPEEIPLAISCNEKNPPPSHIDSQRKVASVSSNRSSTARLQPSSSAFLPQDDESTYQITAPSYTSNGNARAILSSTSVPLQSELSVDFKDGICSMTVASSQLDMDSGRGDSEVESSCVPGILDRKIRTYTVANMSSGGERCTANCALYGHSDLCWMPNEGQFGDQHSARQDLGKVTSPLRLKRVPQIIYSSMPRDNVRKSLYLALGTNERYRSPFRSEPACPFAPNEDLTRHRHLWGKSDDSPYSSVFGSNCSSPIPRNGAICGKTNSCSTPEQEAMLHKQRYLSRDREVDQLLVSKQVAKCDV